jgi:hypothetical protein
MIAMRIRLKGKKEEGREGEGGGDGKSKIHSMEMW